MTAISTTSFPMTRGRRVALVAGVLVCLALVATTGLSLVADLGEGSYPVSYTVPAKPQSLNVTLPGGQLLVRQTTASQATLTGTARYSIVRSKLTESTTSGRFTVGYRCPLPFGYCELDAALNVPAALPVSADTQGGNVHVTGTTGRVTLSTAGGTVTADHASGPLTLNTGGGDINAASVSSPVVSATTSGGNIHATGVSSARVAATSGGGNIEIHFTSVPRNVYVETAGGNVTLVLPAGKTIYSVSAHTAGGSLNDTLPQNQSSPYTISATTGGGNITIRQQ